MKNLLFVFLFSFILSAGQTFACTNYLITKGASADGSTMISYAADSHVLYGELYHWAAGAYPAGTMMDIYEWDTGKFLGKIEQAERTYNVVGNMNEHQVAIGETTYGGLGELGSQSGAIMDYGSLIYVTLQRAKTAREAIMIMGELVEKYGYYSSGESFSIADKNEVWIMEMIGKGEGNKGAVWVAVKIPDGYVSGHANQARIQTFPLADKKTSITDEMYKYIDKETISCIYSHDVISFAKEKSLFDGADKDFSFSDTYAPVDFGGARFCEIRVWSMFREVSDDMDKYTEYVVGHDLTNRMPLYIKPNRKISVQDMMHFMRNSLQGTKFDMANDIGAGPFKCPYRWRPLTFEVDGETYVNERATVTQQTGFSFVTQSRSWLPDEIGGIFWFSVDDAGSTVYTPIYSSSRSVPETFAVGNGGMMEWSDNAAFWVFSQVSNFAYTRYNLIHPEIAAKQDSLETSYVAKVKEIDAEAQELYKYDKTQAIYFLSDFSASNADQLTMCWKKFYQYLFMKYMDGNVKTVNPNQRNPDLEQPGYGPEWEKRIADDNGEILKMTGSMAH
jgi:dipeptidase